MASRPSRARDPNSHLFQTFIAWTSNSTPRALTPTPGGLNSEARSRGQSRCLTPISPPCPPKASTPRSNASRTAPATEDQLAALRATPGVVEILADGGSPDVLSVGLADLRRDAPAAVRTLVGAGADLLGLREEARSLEAVYFEVMGSRPQLEGPVG